MSLKIADSSLGIEIKNVNVKIGYFTINRSWLFENGEKKFSANLYLEYSAENGEIYYRKCVTLEGISLEEFSLENFYKKVKEMEDFKDSADNL